MGIKQNPNNPREWFLDYAVRDKNRKQHRCRKIIHGSFGDAQDEYNRLIASTQRKVIDRGNCIADTLRMRKMADKYIEYQKELGARSIKDTVRHIEYSVEFFGADTLVKDLRQNQILEYREWHKARNPEIKPQSINRFVAYLRAMINMAEKEEWEGFTKSPIKTYRMIPEQREPKQPIPVNELKLLIEHSHKDLRDLIHFLLYTGCRISEALKLEWSNIDLENRQMLINTKDSKRRGRVIPKMISDYLLPILNERLKDNEKIGSPFLFPNNDDPSHYTKSMKTAWKTACRNAGLVGITPHMLRHTFASWLRMSDVDIETVSKLIGHRDVQTTSSYYSHLGNSYLLSKVNKIGEIFPPYKIEGKTCDTL